MPKYLISRTVDPLLGVFTGFLAYYLHETNPRTAPGPGHTLRDLIVWKYNSAQVEREAVAAAAAVAEQDELEAVRRELAAAEVVDESVVLGQVKAASAAAAATATTTGAATADRAV
ncbi:uncharacterized protein EHS24_004121 [Apiotrichum porosum]|uniref:Uncharacterized protein n=1 Tax=Apiotrichum porosum TaxID=105984 RepID=A0A427Y4B2_9TREE|nr:uncharacterized protein EHS24_004121 [Apiotrichum porosum]RSH85936.1 hypothetical protein EHS24_004121 [Apiotrichum porosum]